MDVFGLVLHSAAGFAGGWCVRRGYRSDRAAPIDTVIAGGVGGLIGGQIAERSMGLGTVPVSSISFDPGAAIVSAGGAAVGGAVLALLIGRFVKRFGSH